MKKYYNPSIRHNGTVNGIIMHGATRYIANYMAIQDAAGNKCCESQIKETFEEADRVMVERGYVRVPEIHGEITTHKELFRVIRELSNAGFFFKVVNYYKGGKTDRPGYMVEILGHKFDD